MSNPYLRRRIHTHLIAAALLASGISAGTAQPGAQPITVLVDEARLIKAPDQVATLVIGNPLIADVALQPGGVMVVTGKGYGTTNLIAMDRNGNVLEEHNVQVQASTTRLVTVYRGIERETYSCTPVCERRVMLGDMPTYFNANLMQGGTLNDRAVTAAATAIPSPAGALPPGALPPGTAPGQGGNGQRPQAR